MFKIDQSGSLNSDEGPRSVQDKTAVVLVKWDRKRQFERLAAAVREAEPARRPAARRRPARPPPRALHAEIRF